MMGAKSEASNGEFAQHVQPGTQLPDNTARSNALPASERR